jgi:hypothetical protein
MYRYTLEVLSGVPALLMYRPKSPSKKPWEGKAEIQLSSTTSACALTH